MPFDLRTLRSFRCLRPLKMVSKVPSKFIHKLLQAELDKVETCIVAEDLGFQPKYRKQNSMIKKLELLYDDLAVETIFESHPATNHGDMVLFSYKGLDNHVHQNYRFR